MRALCRLVTHPAALRLISLHLTGRTLTLVNGHRFGQTRTHIATGKLGLNFRRGQRLARCMYAPLLRGGNVRNRDAARSKCYDAGRSIGSLTAFDRAAI